MRPSLSEQAGAVIRAARGDRSQRATARELGIAANTLNELELGRDNPTLARLERVADALGIRLAIVRDVDAGDVDEPAAATG